MSDTDTPIDLNAQFAEFQRSPFLAMPIAGTLVWTTIGVGSAFLDVRQAALLLFIGTGAIFYVGMAIGRLTGENMLRRGEQLTYFDRVFLMATAAALAVYAITIPFFLIEPTSLPLSVGILTGLMWFPFSALIRHWVGLFHGAVRTIGIVAVWYAWPDARFTAVAAVIVLTYLVSIVILRQRYRTLTPTT